MTRARVVGLLCIACVVTMIPARSARSDSMSAEITVSAGDYDESLPDVAYNSVHDEYLVVWHMYYPGWPRTVVANRYRADGVYLGEFIIAYDIVPSRDNIQPSVAYDPVNDRYLVVWVHDFFGDGSDLDIYGRFVPWDGVVEYLPAFKIGDAIGHQWSPRVAYGGSVQEFMVTWWNQSPAGAAHNVAAQRIAAAGNLLGNVIDVTSDPLEARVSPDIAYNQARNEYLIAYQKMEAGGGDIYGVRLSGAGAILGAGDFGVAGWPDAEGAPRIAASQVSDTWAVAWHSVIGPTNWDVYARTITVDGTGTVQLSTPVHPGNNTGNDSYPDINAHPGSSSFLVAWQVEYASPGAENGIWSRVLNAGGTLGAGFKPRELWAGETHDCVAPAVAGGGNDWMVVWQHGRDGSPTYEDIHGRVLFTDVFADGFESNDTTEWSSTVP